MLASAPGIAVVGGAGSAAGALARVPALRPDVAVVDLRLPDGDGVTLCRDLRARLPRLRVLLLTSYGDDEALLDAVVAGSVRLPPQGGAGGPTWSPRCAPWRPAGRRSTRAPARWWRTASATPVRPARSRS
ncbi:MAG: response regulator [Quadrisphaera sp.]